VNPRLTPWAAHYAAPSALMAVGCTCAAPLRRLWPWAAHYAALRHLMIDAYERWHVNQRAARAKEHVAPGVSRGAATTMSAEPALAGDRIGVVAAHGSARVPQTRELKDTSRCPPFGNREEAPANTAWCLSPEHVFDPFLRPLDAFSARPRGPRGFGRCSAHTFAERANEWHFGRSRICWERH
jgi:hypothetical protein